MTLRPSPRPRHGHALCGLLVVVAGLCACAATPPPAPAAATGNGEAPGRPRDSVTSIDFPPPLLRGARCAPGATTCTCRKPGDDAESEPPAQGMKRLEVRLSFLGGEGALLSPALGRMPASGVADTCYYVDVPSPGTTHVRLEGRATDETAGFVPRIAISEYGPAGPHWYEVLRVDCVGVGGRCDRAGADAWAASLKQRKRGRIDPCGSMVVTALKWDTTGGLAHRDNGFYRDFHVDFDLETKKFAPQFPPHSTECVPK